MKQPSGNSDVTGMKTKDAGQGQSRLEQTWVPDNITELQMAYIWASWYVKKKKSTLYI